MVRSSGSRDWGCCMRPGGTERRLHAETGSGWLREPTNHHERGIREAIPAGTHDGSSVDAVARAAELGLASPHGHQARIAEVLPERRHDLGRICRLWCADADDRQKAARLVPELSGPSPIV